MKMSARQLQQHRIKKSSLHERTLLYWQISKAFIGKGPLAGLSVEAAIGLLSDLEEVTPVESALWEQVSSLLDSIIERPVRQKRKPRKQPKKYIPTHYDDDDDWDGPSAA